MAIQVRRGNESDFDASKMLPGEWAVSLDTKYVRMCFAPGVVLRMATYESFENDKAQIKAILAECRSIQSAVQRIQAEVNSKASLVVEYSNNAKTSADKAHSEAERAKIYADNAEAVTGVQIATKERAGLIKGGDNHIAEDGTLMLITATTSTTQPNSYAGRENILEIGGGESEQDSTSGKNLLDCRGLIETQKNGITFTPVYENEMLQYIEVNGTATARADLAISKEMYVTDRSIIFSGISGGSSATYSMFLSMVGNDTTCNSVYNAEKEITFADDVIYYVAKIRVMEGKTVSNLKLYPMIRKVDIADAAYEPYTGGIPAPNPSYQMEIKKSVVSGIRTHGKNFLKYKQFSGSGKGITVTSNNDMSVSVNGVSTGRAQFQLCAVLLKAGTYVLSQGIVSKGNTACLVGAYVDENGESKYVDLFTDADGMRSFTLTQDTEFAVKVDVRNADMSVSNVTLYPMLEEGTVTTEYEPYTESSATLSQPIELYGMNGVRDVITAKPIKRRFAKRVFDGSDDEGWKQSSTYNTRYYVNIPSSVNGAIVLCTQGVKRDATKNGSCRIDKNLNFSLDTEFATLEEWKAHLAEKPMEVVYELAEEVTEELPIVDQIGLNSLATYDGITHLEFIYEGPQPTFKGEYGTSKVGGYTLESLLTARNNELKQNMVNERLSALEASVVNNI